MYLCGFSISFFTLFCYRKTVFGDFIYSVKDWLIQASLFRDFFWVQSIDGISWTLEVEIKFYFLVFLLLFSGKIFNKNRIMAISGGMTLFNIVLFANTEFLITYNVRIYQILSVLSDSFIYMIFILIGSAVYCLYSGKWDKHTFSVALQCLVICFILSVINNGNKVLLTKFIVNYFGAFCVFMNFYLAGDRLKDKKVLHFIGDRSYSIYLLHGLNGYILLSIFCQIGVPPLLCILLAVGTVAALAILFHHFVELPFQRLTSYIVNRIQSSGYI